jgi:hypothetical protein
MNTIYPLFRQALFVGAANASLNVDTDTDGVYCALVRVTGASAYVYSPTHQFYSDLTGIASTPLRVTTPTVAGGVFDGDDLEFLAVSTGETAIGAVVLYRKNSGANTTWRLIAYSEDAGGVFPVVPNGGDIQITWDAAGILT